MSHICPIIDLCSVVWSTGFLGDSRALEKVQRRWTERVDGLSEVPYGARLAYLDLYSVRGRLLRNNLKMVWKILHGLCPSLADIFQLNVSGVTRGHSLKLFVPHCEADVRSRFFSVRVIPLWNGLTDYVVSSPSIDSYSSVILTVTLVL